MKAWSLRYHGKSRLGVSRWGDTVWDGLCVRSHEAPLGELCRPGVGVAELEAGFWGRGVGRSRPRGTKKTTQGEGGQAGEGGTVLGMELGGRSRVTGARGASGKWHWEGQLEG